MARISLEAVKVASPCSISWEAMTGDDQVRFCHDCKKKVFNLSALSREEGEALIEERTEGMCVRLYRRADGTVLTADCPVGLRAVRRRAALAVGALAAGLLLMLSWGAGLRARARASTAPGASATWSRSKPSWT